MVSKSIIALGLRHPCEREDLVPLHVVSARYPIGVGYDGLVETCITK